MDNSQKLHLSVKPSTSLDSYTSIRERRLHRDEARTLHSLQVSATLAQVAVLIVFVDVYRLTIFVNQYR